MITIIYAHPKKESFNAGILNTILDELNKKNIEYNLVDLYKDGFIPTLSEKELELSIVGEFQDELVGKYQKYLKESNSIIFIFPIWWKDCPAILKGFQDKVMLRNFAFKNTKFGPKGLLMNIKKTIVITTAYTPKWFLHFLSGNSIKGVFINSNLKSFGLKNVKWLHCHNLKKDEVDKREKFIHTCISQLGDIK